MPPGLTVANESVDNFDFAGERGIIGVSKQSRAGVNHAGMVFLVEPQSMRGALPTYGTVLPLALPPPGGDALFFDGTETAAYRAWRGLPALRGRAGSGYPVRFAVAARSPMIDWSQCSRVPEQGPLDEAVFRAEVLPLARPRVFRGAVAHWPAVSAAREGDAALCAYLRAQGGDAQVEAFFLAPAAGGRVFYADDSLSRLNYDRRSLPLAELLSLLFEYRAAAKPPAFYAGAVRMPQVMPGFVRDNPLPFPSPSAEPLVSLWIGNRTRVAAHWDLPSNLICVVGGRRRYILFPPQQIGNLYPGPLEFTPAGQPVSLVDFHAPDLARFPRFAEAARHAQVAELGPGDALYLPSLWWHHAESLDVIGAMVNAWWREAPAHATTPSTTLQHALLTLRDLPPDERAAWRALFDHYIFDDPQAAVSHLPEAARGILGAMTPEQAARLRAHIARSLQW